MVAATCFFASQQIRCISNFGNISVIDDCAKNNSEIAYESSSLNSFESSTRFEKVLAYHADMLKRSQHQGRSCQLNGDSIFQWCSMAWAEAIPFVMSYGSPGSPETISHVTMPAS